MNKYIPAIKSFAVIFLVSVLLYRIGMFAVTTQTAPTQTIQTPAPISTLTPATPAASSPSLLTYTSLDESLTFSYPSNWELTQASPDNEPTEVGTIVEAWNLTQTSIQPITIEFLIAANPPTQSIIDCSNPLLTCDKLTINDQVFDRAVILDNITTILTYFTRTNNKLYLVTASFTDDTQSQADQEIDQIIQTIVFN
jgi:hypothetical protein